MMIRRQQTSNLLNKSISDTQLAYIFCNRNRNCRNRNIMMVGWKGSGKSSANRYACNRLLKKFGKVIWLECDPGQPEFDVPGFMNLVNKIQINYPQSHFEKSLPSCKFLFSSNSDYPCLEKILKINSNLTVLHRKSFFFLAMHPLQQFDFLLFLILCRGLPIISFEKILFIL